MSDKSCTIVYADDWTGIYLNGQLMYQHHRIDIDFVLNKLGYSVEHIDMGNDDLSEYGNSFPNKLSELKK